MKLVLFERFNKDKPPPQRPINFTGLWYDGAIRGWLNRACLLQSYEGSNSQYLFSKQHGWTTYKLSHASIPICAVFSFGKRKQGEEEAVMQEMLCWHNKQTRAFYSVVNLYNKLYRHISIVDNIV